jgi:hypothetical protein
MSADNWTTCPRCFKAWLAEKEKKEQDIKATYGQVAIKA